MVFLLAKVTDDLLMAVSYDLIHGFTEEIKSRFEIRKAIIYEELLLKGFHTMRDSQGNLEMSMQRYVELISYLRLDELRGKQQS